jgi:hypothetical protein
MIKGQRKSQIAFVLFLFISFLSIGSYGFMYLMKFQIRAAVHAMIKELDDSELTVIKQLYVKGVEKEHEIIVNGKFYDISKYKIEADSITFYCFYDKAETELTNLSSHWHEFNLIKTQRNQLSYLFKITDIKYIQSNFQLQAILIPIPIYFMNINESESFVYCDVLSPPPRLF